jgi:hypothetical protein
VTSLPATFGAAISAESLERNELISIPVSPFPLPTGDERGFLLGQTTPHGRKDLSFDPQTGMLGGSRTASAVQQRLAAILTAFSEAATAWLTSTFPAYAGGLVKDRVTLRTQEEATRALRLTSRNDLLHIDNFPTRPTNGRRILRVYTNINPTDPQVWAISERFGQLVARYAARRRIPDRSIEEWLSPSKSLVQMFGIGRGRSNYDAWMSRLHHFLKQDEAFQIHAPRRLIAFPPGAMWALFSDGLAHAQLRGQFALEHSFFVCPECLVCPEEWPVARLAAPRANDSAHPTG